MPSAVMDDSLSELWRRLFRTALIDWVHDFLFQTDPATQASILLSPLQATNSLVMSTCATQLEHGADNNMPHIGITSTWLLLPAFSVGAVSVGIVVERGTRPGSSRLVRYVRCDTTGDTLCFCDDAESDEIEIEFLTYASPARSTRAYFRFTRAVLDCLHAARGASTIDTAPLRAALLHSMVLSETRACAVCGAPPRDSCACSFDFATPQHPLDFRHTARNTLPLLGDFQGSGTSTTFREGRIVSTTHIATHLLTRSGAPGGATDRMIFWAVQRCLAHGHPNPLALAMPYCTEEEESDARMTELCLHADDVAANGSQDALVPILPSQETMLPVRVAAQRVTSQCATPLAVVPEAKREPTEISAANNRKPAMIMPPLQLPAGDSIRLPRKRGWIAIAPAPGTPGLQPGVASGNAGGTTGEIQYSNAERRKIMKREAAARSNAKRREVVALQKSIDKEREKAALLSLREQSLKEENCRLRLQLANF